MRSDKRLVFVRTDFNFYIADICLIAIFGLNRNSGRTPLIASRYNAI